MKELGNEFTEAWPAYDPERVAAAVAALAERVAEKDVRVQLHALSAVIRNLGREGMRADERALHAAALAEALAAEDDDGIMGPLRRLTKVNRDTVRPVDWSAASGG